MDFSFSEDQTAIRDMARGFAADRLAPNAAEWDAKAHFPKDVYREAAGLGLAAMYTTEEHGGSGLGRMDAALVFEALAEGCVTTSAFLSIHNMVSWMVDSFGSDETRAEYLPALCSMDQFASYCLTEPGSGSDAASLKTSATTHGNADYKLNGGKAFISGGGTSDVYLVMARTSDDGPKGVSAFLVPKDAKGISFGKTEEKMGWNSQPTAQVMLDDCVIPARNRLGNEGEGFTFAMKGLDGGRINIAACSLGGAKAAMTAAANYAAERKQFGKPIADFQTTQTKLADMATEFAACQMMTYRAAHALDSGDPRVREKSAQAKRFVTDTCWHIVDEALQIHGGYGYIKDYGIERLLRDLRVHRILEGTNEIMRTIIARRILKDVKDGTLSEAFDA